MKLKRLLTHAFRSIQDSEVEFGDTMTIFAGPAGTGKSSHLHALCAVLTGRTPHTDRRGAGIKTQIRRDQAKAEIELTCEFSSTQPLLAPSVIKRSITESGQSLEVPFGGKNLGARQALLTERMGGVDEVPDVLLDPRLFADRDEKEQTQALLKLLRPPAIEVPAAARSVGIENLASIQQVDDQIKSLKDGQIRSLNAVIKNIEETIPAEPTPEELTAAHEAEDALAQLDARIQALALEVRNAEFLLDDARKHAAEVEQAKLLVDKLPSLRIQRDGLAVDAKNLGEWESQQKIALANLGNATEVSRRISAGIVAVGNLPGLRTAMEDAKAQLKIAAGRYTELDSEYQAEISVKAEAQGAINAISRQIVTLSTVGEKCPTCYRKLTAKAKDEILLGLNSEQDQLIERVANSSARMEKLTAERGECGAAGAAARNEVNRLTQEVAESERISRDANLKSENAEELQVELDKLRSDIASLIDKYRYRDDGLLVPTLQAERDRVIADITEAERAEKLIAAPQPEIDALEKALLSSSRDQNEAIDKHEAAKASAQSARDTLRRDDDYTAAAARLPTERSKRESYSMAVESLSKLKDSILEGEAARKLQFDCTDIFQQFFPQTRVILDPSGASVSPIGSNIGTPVAHLSSGQKVIFDMGLRIAAARSTGFNLLAIDDANKLAPAAREGMLKCLMASGCQVIMCTTADGAGKIPGAVVYRVSSPAMWGPTKVERVK